MTYRNHILELCRRYRIALDESAKNVYEVMAYNDGRKIVCFPIKNLRTYLLALHEIGHFLWGKEKILDDEICAWMVAKRLAKKWGEQGDNLVKECLGSYIQRYRNDKRVRVSKFAKLYIKRLIKR